MALQSQTLAVGLQEELQRPLPCAAKMTGEQCSWCGVAVTPDDGFRAAEPEGERRAVFCRLEHVVPWAIQGAHWDAGTIDLPSDQAVDRCAHCGKPLGDVHVVLVRHRGEHRIGDGFCGVDHLQQWARAGGRWG
jgi:hypothetical protein